MKIKNILFPVDFSECSFALNQEVEWLASRFNSKVTLLNVFEVPVSWYGSGEAPLMSPDCFQQFAADARKRLADYPLQLPENQIDRATAEGDIAWQIKSWVEEHDADLVMMGTHGYGAMRRLLLGSVAMKILHDVSCPVWTHSPSRTASTGVSVSNILCALELTEEAVPLLRFAKQLARQFNAQVRIIHSVPETESRPYKYFDRDLNGFLMKSANEEIARQQKEAGTDFPVELTAKPIAQFTADLGSGQPVDLIVLGRGKTQEAFGTLRTHTYEILRQAPCPVLSYCSEQQGAGGLVSQFETTAQAVAI